MLTRYPEAGSIPTVTFDVKMGRQLKGEVIDFDFASYTDHLRREGLRESEIAAGRIDFKPNTIRAPHPIHALTRSGAFGWSEQAGVRTGHIVLESLHTLDRDLKHETVHWTDFATGKFEQNFNRAHRSYELEKWGYRLMLGAVAAEAASAATLHNGLLDLGCFAVAAAGFVTAQVAHATNIQEQRAHEGEKAIPGTFVSISPLPANS